MEMASIYPNNLNIKYDYVKVNNTFVAGIIITELSSEIGLFDFVNAIPKDIKNETSIYVKKLNLKDEIKRLSKVISETGADIKSSNVNELGIDMTRKINEEAITLRKKLQVENEDIFKLSIYITVSDLNLDSLKIKVDKIISDLYSKNIIAKIANFRHDKVYLNSLPIHNFQDNLISQTGVNVTSSQLAYMLPYIKSELYDKSGILYGYINNSFCIYDIFSKNNMNYNMCILGSSGAGKSYFMKINIMRNFCMNIRQAIFDIEGEYKNIADSSDSTIFNIANWNMLYIPEMYALKNADFLVKKIELVYNTLNRCVQGKLIKYEAECKNIIKEVYEKFGITSNASLLYEYCENDKLNVSKTYKRYSMFPSVKELIDTMIAKINFTKQIKDMLISLEYYNKYDINSAKCLDERYDTLMVFDMNSLNISHFNIYVDYIEQYYGEKLIIYIDEVWKFMSLNEEENIANRITELYKTIRKKKAGIVIASQDIHDILKNDNGMFGKSILNNSFTKVFFKMQYVDLGTLAEIGVCENGLIDKIKRLNIGRACMSIGNMYFNLEIKASKFEEEIIKGGNEIEEITYSN